MDKTIATSVFESLASGIRLDVYRLLVRAAPTGMVAGEIATTLNIPPNNLSFHLKGMVYAGLLAVEQEGRFQRYRANLPMMQALIDYLTEECCSGHPERCEATASGKRARKCADAISAKPASTARTRRKQ